jgi:hypothetical protein
VENVPMINEYVQMLSQANALRATLEEKLANARESVRKKDERIDKLDKIVQAQIQNLDEEKEIANRRLIDYSVKIAELEKERGELIKEFAEAECMGDLAKITRQYGYEALKDKS